MTKLEELKKAVDDAEAALIAVVYLDAKKAYDAELLKPAENYVGISVMNLDTRKLENFEVPYSVAVYIKQLELKIYQLSRTGEKG